MFKEAEEYYQGTHDTLLYLKNMYENYGSMGASIGAAKLIKLKLSE